MLDIRTNKSWTLLANGQFYEDGCYSFMMQFDLYNGPLLSENNIQFAKLAPILATPMYRDTFDSLCVVVAVSRKPCSGQSGSFHFSLITVVLLTSQIIFPLEMKGTRLPAFC